MIGFAAVVAAATLVAGVAAGALVLRLPTLRLRLSGLALSAVMLPLAAVLLSGVVMFDSEHDLTILAVAAASSTAALLAALAVARSIGRGLEPLRRAAEQIAAGHLSARAPESPPRELSSLASDFNEMATRLEQLFDARAQLVAWASHDLRTPLASMQAMLEALEDGLAYPDQYVPALRDQVRTLSLLVDDLFELARIDAGMLTLELREAPLSGLVQSCLRSLEAQARSRHVSLEAEIDEGMRVLCAPEKLERVLFNLLTNALRHTPSDGSVAVRAEARAGEVEVTVEDTGQGLAQEALSARRDGGLGLVIARGLVEAHGGRIWAENRPGGGARFSFTLRAA